MSSLLFLGESAIQVIECVGTGEVGRERIESVSATAEAKNDEAAAKEEWSAKPLIRHEVAELFRVVCASDNVAATSARRHRIRDSTLLVVCCVRYEDAAEKNEDVSECSHKVCRANDGFFGFRSSVSA